jgi:hypothetical protein
MCAAVCGAVVYQRARGGIARGWIAFHAFILAGAATLLGWSQSLIYKDVPEVPLALWFPSIVLMDVHGEAMILISLIQFPTLALVFALATRRWSVITVTAILAIFYAICACVAYSTVVRGISS